MRVGILLFMAFVISSCSKEHEGASLFEPVDWKVSGINFSNDLTETTEFNILEYLYFYNGGGVAVGDINNDSLPDIYFTANQKSNRLYLNQGGLKFKDITEVANVAGNGNWATGVTMADVNGDGLLDIYVSYVSGYKGTKGHNELYINNGDLNFTESAKEYGLDFAGFGTHAAFFDYDNDTDLDVYLLNHSVHGVDSYGNAGRRNLSDSRAGDVLLESQVAQGDMRFVNVTETAGIFSSKIGYGLGVSTADINNDGWQDIYVSNDFHENDYLYLNNQDGTFSESLERVLGHSSRYSMGNDIADVNNDGLLDIFTTDMLPSDPSILLKSGGEDKSEISEIKLKYGYGPQLARNTLQLNRGNGHFSDIALQAGLYATDWSWTPLLADFDNDGHKDLFITNGIVKRPNDLDYIQYISNLPDYRYTVKNQDSIEAEMIKRMPELKISNEVFKGIDGVYWTNQTKEWGLDQPTYSNGAASSDLDNDGDLDLVINNINEKAFVYENNTIANNYIKLTLTGAGYNKFAVGSRVVIKSDDDKLTYLVGSSKGFQSSVSPDLTIGLGQLQSIDTLEVFWASGKYQVIENVEANQWLTISEPDSIELRPILTPTAWLTEMNDQVEWRHEENNFNDYNQDYLRPYKLSTLGPALSVGDINGDGKDDAFVGGAKGQPSAILIQEGSKLGTQLLAGTEPYENVASALVDVDGDSDLDLVVAAAGHEYITGHPFLQDRLYLNEGGDLKLSTSFPELRENSTCIASNDYDNDGDIDLFIGYDGSSGTYGLKGGGFILQNQGDGTFINVTKQIAPTITDIGMVKAAEWLDYDNDGDADLALAGHWMPITLLVNEGGSFQSVRELENSSGFWNTIRADDIDKDGDADLIAGNIGTNNKFSASTEFPLKLYVGDFDQNGTEESVIMHYIDGRCIPLSTKDELEKQLVSIKKRYSNYSDFAESIDGISSLVELNAEVAQMEIQELSSAVFYNNSGDLSMKKLPVQMQWSSINSIMTIDVNGDGWKDIITAGNNFHTHISLGRYDADYGSMALSQNGKSFEYIDNSESGLAIVGQVSNFGLVRLGTETQLFFALNNDSIKSYKFNLYKE